MRKAKPCNQSIDVTNEHSINEILKIFDCYTKDIVKMVEFIKPGNEGYKIILELPLSMANPFEDSIRYRYITIVEYFKVVSNSIANKYYKINGKNDYKKMNNYIFFDNKELMSKLMKGIKLRDFFAHISESYYYLDIMEIDVDSILNNLKTFKIILSAYVAFLNSKLR